MRSRFFTLMSRGLPYTEAEKLIVEGFFEPVMERIPLESVREELNTSYYAQTWVVSHQQSAVSSQLRIVVATPSVFATVNRLLKAESRWLIAILPITDNRQPISNKKGELTMSQPKIIAYMKPVCGWSNGVRAIFAKYGLAYEDRDIINNENNYREMVQKTRQPYQPCVQIDDVMLADVSGDEVEQYLVSEGIVKSSDAETDVPTDQACEDHGPSAVNIGFPGR